jgi:hypothetical protein
VGRLICFRLLPHEFFDVHSCELPRSRRDFHFRTCKVGQVSFLLGLHPSWFVDFSSRFRQTRFFNQYVRDGTFRKFDEYLRLGACRLDLFSPRIHSSRQ